MTLAEPTHHHTDTDDLAHVVCCDDDHTALCGTRDLTSTTADEPDCTVCLDLEHTDHCPNGWTCP